MKLRHAALTLIAVVSFSSIADAQEPADTNASVATKQQIRAEMKADKAANRELARKVQGAIYKTKDLSGAEIAVFAKAKTGKVILAGMIVDESQDQVAQDAASKVAGVRSVTSKLTVYEAP